MLLLQMHVHWVCRAKNHHLYYVQNCTLIPHMPVHLNSARSEFMLAPSCCILRSLRFLFVLKYNKRLLYVWTTHSSNHHKHVWRYVRAWTKANTQFFFHFYFILQLWLSFKKRRRVSEPNLVIFVNEQDIWNSQQDFIITKTQMDLLWETDSSLIAFVILVPLTYQCYTMYACHCVLKRVSLRMSTPKISTPKTSTSQNVNFPKCQLPKCQLRKI